MANNPIGIYAHHQGSGHMTQAIQIAKALTQQVVLFSSHKPVSELPKNVRFVLLPDDNVAGYVQPDDSVFLYSPWNTRVLDRYGKLLSEIRRHQIQLMYVDLSPEIAVFCKILGLTVGTSVLLGDRTDRAHTYGYDAVDFMIATFPEQFDTKSNRSTRIKPTYVGGVSRYKKSQPQKISNIKTVMVTTSADSKALQVTDIDGAASANPHIQWRVVGPLSEPSDHPNVTILGVIPDPIKEYRNADAVIGAGGLNTTMELASLGKPFICIPEARPFDEQIAVAKTLQRLRAAVYLKSWPKNNEWPTVFDALHKIDLTAFNGLVSDSAIQKIAKIITTYS